MPFRYIDEITSDVMFEVSAKDMPGLLADAAKAMFNVMYDIKKVKKERSIKIQVSGKDDKALLYSWLSKALAEAEIRDMFFCDFKAKKTKGTALSHDVGKVKQHGYEVECFGDSADASLLSTIVKGVTYYKFEVSKTKQGYKAMVVVDI